MHFTAMGRLWLSIACISSLGIAEAAEHPDARKTSVSATPYTLFGNPQGGLYIDTADTLRHLDLVVALDGFITRRPLGIRDTNSGEWLRSLVDHRERVNVRSHLGLWGRVDLALDMPVILFQSAQYPGQRIGPVADTGIGDLGIYTKLKLIDPLNRVGLAICHELRLPTGNEGAWMGTGTYGMTPCVLISRASGNSHVGFKASYRFLPTTKIFDLRDGNRIELGIMMKYTLPFWQERLTVNSELVAHARADDPTSGQAENGAFWNSGLKVRWSKRWATTMGGGGAFTRTYGLPQWRALFSVEFRKAFINHPPDCRRKDAYTRDERCPPPDADGDGVPDFDDKCPSVPEDIDTFEDKDGCPDPDNDKDGLLDKDDKCPLAAEDIDKFEDDDGCPDEDNDQDGIPDVKDKCPLEKETINQFEDDDGCPEPDTDKDGVIDAKDQCPKVPEDLDSFEDDDGCPDPDNDRDGIADVDDRCPDTPENVNGYRDEDGCPDQDLAVKTRTEIVITEEIHFRLGQVVPRKRSRRIIKAVHKILRKQPNLRIRVEGHTDNFGGTDFNRYLSQARAQAIKDILVRMSDDPDAMNKRLEAVGVGKAQPKRSDETKTAHDKNRRVRFLILK